MSGSHAQWVSGGSGPHLLQGVLVCLPVTSVQLAEGRVGILEGPAVSPKSQLAVDSRQKALMRKGVCAGQAGG